MPTKICIEKEKTGPKREKDANTLSNLAGAWETFSLALGEGNFPFPCHSQKGVYIYAGGVLRLIFAVVEHMTPLPG